MMVIETDTTHNQDEQKIKEMSELLVDLENNETGGDRW